MGKMLVLIGLVLVFLGVLIHYAPKIPLGRLPGDLRIEQENFSFYFPMTSCILVSLFIMLVVYLWNRLT